MLSLRLRLLENTVRIYPPVRNGKGYISNMDILYFAWMLEIVRFLTPLQPDLWALHSREVLTVQGEGMDVSAWSNGLKKPKPVYGITVGRRNRLHFDPTWKTVEIELDGTVSVFKVSKTFWDRCPEIRDIPGAPIRAWLAKHKRITWAYRRPPRFSLIPIGGRRFRVVG